MGGCILKTRIIDFKDWQTHERIKYARSQKLYPVTINHTARLKALVKSCHFKEAMRGMNGSFLQEEALPLKATYVLLRFDHEISGGKVRAFFTDSKRVPATLREVLCFFLSLPSLRPLPYDVIALGSRWYDRADKRICVPFIDIRWRLRLTIGEGYYTNQDVFLLRAAADKV